MKITHKIGFRNLEAYGDLVLIFSQVRGKFKVRHEDLVPYHTAATQMAGTFKTFYIHLIPGNRNSYADALAPLAISLAPLAISLAPKPGASLEMLVFTLDLYHPKSVIKDVPIIDEDAQCKDKEVLEASASSELKD